MSLDSGDDPDESFGTILEAAFVDPAYQWPPPDGEGKNAIEMQASITLMNDGDSVQTTESQRERMEIPPKPEPIAKKKKLWQCCTNTDAAMLSLQEYEEAKKIALKARKEHHLTKKLRSKDVRKKNRYNRVPEGILIYRLDTSNQTLSLMSDPHNNTNLDTIVREMVVAAAGPSTDKSRRGMLLTTTDARQVSMVACDQRTAIAWLEAMDIMLANKRRLGKGVSITQELRMTISGLGIS
jgi:hypothetical protein